MTEKEYLAKIGDKIITKDDVESAINSLDNLIQKNDVVLVKASRGMKLEEIVEYLSK